MLKIRPVHPVIDGKLALMCNDIIFIMYMPGMGSNAVTVTKFLQLLMILEL